ncbi:MAG: hypothetical protein KA354_03755 [Phycisphaerae bacterium]|nr:hypothetical protein [Phycisphaerae bacterium]
MGWTGRLDGEGSFGTDPLLRYDVPGDARLGQGSPCIDAGNNAVAIGPDLADRPRFIDDLFTPDTGTGSSPIVDMGAHEYYPDCNRNEVDDHEDIAGGSSMDCNQNANPDECDVGAGVEKDCNGNGVPDSCDLSAGTSEDCNENGQPDECGLADETVSDCNGNGVPDICDIMAGTSKDANGNGVPDECEPPPCVATRELPTKYSPGLKVTAIIKVKPGAGTAVYAVEDKPPTGWSVGAITEPGFFDAATGKVK